MIYGYIRVSTDRQTVENQRFEIENYCANHNLHIDKWIEETISFRTQLKDRKLGKLLKRLKNKDVLIASEISRLGRNLLQVMGILQMCLEKECQIWTIKENYRLGADIGSKVLAFAFALSAEIERQLISQRTKESLNRLKAYWPHLAENEGYERHAYLDTEGKITAGMGLYIPDEKSFTSLPWQYQGKEATFEQKVAEYQRLEAFQKSGQFGRNYLADDFRLKVPSKELTLSDHFIIDKTMEHLECDLKVLETKYPEFENYPMSLQVTLLDMQYNMGGNFTVEKWPSFHEGLRNKDITKMAEQSHRYQVGEARNNWIREILLNIPPIDGWHYSSK